ncbi:DUF2750 domain-containing protein [Exiguobacterium acetylicum]|uniref:DUF2750 domain-containing protein n=1 Tax=Exiguobacterium TaxID=33986 RepID=UPI000ECACCEC|nr:MULTISPECIES: DUF2750 domain-containing protein [Exiguobacterium]MDQ6466491.1 DUF2750 domain-containing protein [Exiguobacterium acetylicum]HAB34196.1 hypothetical protein [Exiguobacterium sp.]
MIYQSGLPGVTEERLQEVETALGCELPKELRNRYKRENKFNVGEWEFHPIKDEQYIKRTWDDLVRVNLTDAEEYPEGFLRIAADGTGDELGYQFPDTKTIVWWDHEEQELFPVAPTLMAFIEKEQQMEQSAEQAEDFLQTVLETDAVYGLSKFEQSGWAYCPSNQEETDVLLFFSTEAGAKALQMKEWADYHLIRLDLDLFMDGWLPNMIDDGLYCGLNWGTELVGIELDPEDVLADLEG